MAKFIDPMTDTGFKIVFGKENQSNKILMAFLNELFKDESGFEPIVKLKYTQPGHRGGQDHRA